MCQEWRFFSFFFGKERTSGDASYVQRVPWGMQPAEKLDTSNSCARMRFSTGLALAEGAIAAAMLRRVRVSIFVGC